MWLIALGLRLIAVALTRHLGIGLDDMFQYDMLARSLASGHGFRWYAPADLARLAPFLHLDLEPGALDPRGLPTTFRAPLYPLFLALVYRLSGLDDGRFLAARLAQAILLGAPLAPLTYFTTRRLLAHPAHLVEEDKIERAARLAAWTVAAYPLLVIFPLALATENLFFLLVLAAVFCLAGLARDSRAPVRDALLCGFLLGLAALTRSVILPFAGLALLWIALSLRRPRHAALAALALMATITPWVVRNSWLSHKFTGIETSLGYNLYVGYHPQSTGTFTFGPSLDLLSVLDDRARDEIGTRKAVEFIRQAPWRFPSLAVRRLGYFFDLELRAFTYFYVNDFFGPLPAPLLLLILLALALPFVVLSLSACLGAALLRPTPQRTLLILLLAGYLLPHVFIISEDRFHLVLVPFLASVAASFWAHGIHALKSLPRWPRWGAALAMSGLLANWGLALLRQSATLVQMFGPNGHRLYLPY